MTTGEITSEEEAVEEEEEEEGTAAAAAKSLPVIGFSVGTAVLEDASASAYATVVLDATAALSAGSELLFGWSSDAAAANTACGCGGWCGDSMIACI